MDRIQQSLDSILDQLSAIEADWKNGFADEIIAELAFMKEYLTDHVMSPEILALFLERNFEAYTTIFQLFLGLSKDEYRGALLELPQGGGRTSFRKDPGAYLGLLVHSLDLPNVITNHLQRAWSWDDVIVERLRVGRGSAIKGQKRGRWLEDLVEAEIRAVFHETFERGCNFEGRARETAKAEFAIPSATDPRIIFEAKAYGATGSKQTDVLGDIEKIIRVKLPRTVFLFVTDGMTWKQRLNDLRKIVQSQNAGDIERIYTASMMPELRRDLHILKAEFGL